MGKIGTSDICCLIALALGISLLSKVGELKLLLTEYLYLSVFDGSCFFLMLILESKKKLGLQEY